MKTEQVMMYTLFFLCSALVACAVLTMVSVHVPPVHLAHSTLKSLPLAAFASG